MTKIAFFPKREHKTDGKVVMNHTYASSMNRFIMNCTIIEIKELVERHGVDLHSIFLLVPVTVHVQLPSNIETIRYLIESGLTKDHFGPAVFHALLTHPIMLKTEDEILDLINSLVPLGFDLDYHLKYTVLEKLARGITGEGALAISHSPAKLTTLFGKFLDLGCEFSAEEAPHDALRILARGDCMNLVEPLFFDVSEKARYQYYQLNGAYYLLTECITPYSVRTPKINVTDDTMTQAITSWKKALAAYDQPSPTEWCSSVELFKGTEIIGTHNGLNILMANASKVEFVTQALLIVEKHEGGISSKQALAVLTSMQKHFTLDRASSDT